MSDQETLEKQINSLQKQLKIVKKATFDQINSVKRTQTAFWRSKNENIVYLRNELLIGLEIEYKAKIKKSKFLKYSILDLISLRKKEKIIERKFNKLNDDLHQIGTQLWSIRQQVYDYEQYQSSLKRWLRKTTNSDLKEKWETGLLAAKLIQEKKK